MLRSSAVHRCFGAIYYLNIQGKIVSEQTTGKRHSAYSFVSLSVRSSFHPSVHPSTRPFILPSVRPSVHPSVHPSVRPSVRPSVHPSSRSLQPSQFAILNIPCSFYFVTDEAISIHTVIVMKLFIILHPTILHSVLLFYLNIFYVLKLL
jgi:hypothetical protein